MACIGTTDGGGRGGRAKGGGGDRRWDFGREEAKKKKKRDDRRAIFQAFTTRSRAPEVGFVDDKWPVFQFLLFGHLANTEL